MKTSIRNKFLFAFVSFVALSAACQMVFNLFFAMDYYTSEKESAMVNAFESIADAYDGTYESIALAIEPYENQDNINVLVYHESGYILYTNRIETESDRFGFPNRRTWKPPSEKQQPPYPNSDTKGDATLLLLENTFAHGEETIYVFITLSVTSIENSVSILTRASMLISIFVLVISVLASLLLARSITKPIREIEQVSRKLAALDFSQRANEHVSSIELSSLATSLNTMSSNLETSIEALSVANEQLQKDVDYHKQLEQMRREFTANVSHEMKTPLALLQLYANNLKSDLPELDKAFYYDTIIEEADRLSEMVSSLLRTSALENGLSQMTFKPLSMSDFCAEIYAKLTPLLEPFSAHAHFEEGLSVNADKTYLEQAIKNYVSNAISHTAPEQQILFSLTKQGNDAVFTVFNEGAHIAAEDMPHLWESFYRSDKARTRTSNNVGLGLYIVKTILDNHKGRCAADNTDGGVCFSFAIPLIESKDE